VRFAATQTKVSGNAEDLAALQQAWNDATGALAGYSQAYKEFERRRQNADDFASSREERLKASSKQKDLDEKAKDAADAADNQINTRDTKIKKLRKEIAEAEVWPKDRLGVPCFSAAGVPGFTEQADILGDNASRIGSAEDPDRGNRFRFERGVVPGA